MLESTDKVLEELAEGEHVLWSYIDASVAHGGIRANHGIEIRVTNKSVSETPIHTNKDVFCTAKIDVHGRKLFLALPNGIGSIAEMLLPLKTQMYESSGNSCKEYYARFTLGAKKLSRERLVSTLQHLVDSGDPPFVFELRKERTGTPNTKDSLIGFLPTKASLILDGLKASIAENRCKSIRFNGGLPDVRKSVFRAVTAWLRWWFLPIVFLVLTWLLWLSPQEVLTRTPRLWSTGNTSMVVDILPPHPANLSSAFRLGSLRERLILLDKGFSYDNDDNNGTSNTSASAILVMASKLTHRAVSQNQLLNMLEEIERIENHESIVTRVTGTFTFVNIMWFLAILGITVPIGPSIYHILRPIRERSSRVCLFHIPAWQAKYTTHSHPSGGGVAVLHVDPDSATLPERADRVPVCRCGLCIAGVWCVGAPIVSVHRIRLHGRTPALRPCICCPLWYPRADAHVWPRGPVASVTVHVRRDRHGKHCASARDTDSQQLAVL